MAVKRMSAAESAEALAEQGEARKRAARQAARIEGEPETIEIVEVRVLPKGDGKVSMGIHVAGIGEAHYERGERFNIAKPIAEALEERGYVEIEIADAESE